MPARGCGARKRRHKRSAVPDTAALCRDAARCSKLKAVPATSYRAKPATVRVEHARAWQRMLSGRRLDLLDPSPLDIEIEDIAHGLARVARWNGQTSGAHIYSVAQHCLLVEALARGRVPRLDRGRRLAVLLHDAPEYVIGDMISPFKVVIGDAYKAVERRLLEAIHRRFGLPVRNAPELEHLIKDIRPFSRVSGGHAPCRLQRRRSAAVFWAITGDCHNGGAGLPQAVAGRDRTEALRRTIQDLD